MDHDDEPRTTRPVVPLKVNVFEQVRGSNSQLAPLFPYMRPGAIIPCTCISSTKTA